MSFLHHPPAQVTAWEDIYMLTKDKSKNKNTTSLNILTNKKTPWKILSSYHILFKLCSFVIIYSSNGYSWFSKFLTLMQKSFYLIGPCSMLLKNWQVLRIAKHILQISSVHMICSWDLTVWQKKITSMSKKRLASLIIFYPHCWHIFSL